MTPQATQVLTHLQKHGSISQAEANTVYRIRALPRRISDLKEAGHKITRELKKDPTGQRYARYTLAKRPKEGSRVRVLPTAFVRSTLKGKLGTVMSVVKDDDVFNNDDLYVLLDGETSNTYLWEKDVEVIPNV